MSKRTTTTTMKCVFVVVLCLAYVVISAKKLKNKDAICGGKKPSGSFMWSMKRNPPVYFFGTIHVPYTRVWNYIPKSFKVAFERNENIFFELDLTNPRTRAALTRCQLLPRGTRLREVLPADLYQRLKRHLAYIKKAIPSWMTTEQKMRGYDGKEMYDAIVGNWERKKPIWTMLMINSLTKEDVRSRAAPVLDLHLARQAKRLGKQVGAIESVDEQCQPLDGLNNSQVSFILNHTLLSLEKLREGKLTVPYTTDGLIKKYNCRDLDSVRLDIESTQISLMTNVSAQAELLNEGYTADDMATAAGIDSYLKTKLIFRRNQLMAERIKNLLKDKPDESFIFAFGTGHFLGNASVIDILKQDGFDIHNVDHALPSRIISQSFKRRRKQRRLNQRREKNRGKSTKDRNKKSHENLWSHHKERKSEDKQLSYTNHQVDDHYPTIISPEVHKNWGRSSSYLQNFYWASPKRHGSLKTVDFKVWSVNPTPSNSAGNNLICFKQKDQHQHEELFTPQKYLKLSAKLPSIDFQDIIYILLAKMFL